ncbi:MAG TPA: hypothetical protein VK421_07270, partial [Pyrinomonadaceae bacterium]|nr:hypothetical protein [Pyrinomonadaceae bacterium]
MTRSKLMLAGMFTLVLGLFTVLPADASAQGWWDRDQDRRDDRRDRRDDRRDRRRDRRDDRRDRRDDRRDDGVWNQGRYGGSDRWEGRRNQGRYGDNYPDYGGSFEHRQTALNAGYNEGIKEGRKDRQRGERFEYRDESDYQSATKDYNSRRGDRDSYQRYFREAFARGYRDGYNGY